MEVLIRQDLELPNLAPILVAVTPEFFDALWVKKKVTTDLTCQSRKFCSDLRIVLNVRSTNW
jgi:hypothetical protein